MRVLKQGTRLSGRYTLERRIGGGGMAEIWLASDARTDGKVALKFLVPKLAAEPHYRKLFHEEWRLASRLMHAHIVRVFEYHDADEAGPYYSLQYIAGPSITVLAGQPLEQLLRPVGLLADALRYAHGKGIVHRDIKGGNVLLDARGAPCLIDFGVALRDGESGKAGGASRASASLQQLAGDTAHAADDIFALGVLLHELLFGGPPSGDRLPDTTAGGERVPARVRDLLQAMLATEREARPDAARVGQALTDAGFAAGAAVLPHSAVLESRQPEIAVSAIAPRSPRRRSAATGALPDSATVHSSEGVSARVVGLGAAILLAVLLGVLFVLPDRVPSPASEPATAVPVTPPGDREESADDDVQPAARGETREPAGSDAGSKAATDEALGDLLSQLERLRYRGVEHWGGRRYEEALARYADGDDAYLQKDFGAAGEAYREATRMLEPLFDRIDEEFAAAMRAAHQAFAERDHHEAIRQYELAVAITPDNPEAERGLERARSLEDVLALMRRGREFEEDLELEAARQAFATALELDPAWDPAEAALARVRAAVEQRDFEQRMTEGFDALSAGNLDSARAAFEAAKAMRPDSQQPVDGLLQVDQRARLARIRQLEKTAAAQEEEEQWEAAVETYREALEVDADLQFAQEGLRRASERAALHQRLAGYIDDPDSLSQPQVMQAATRLLLDLSRISPTGPRLEDQKEALSRLLKRAATPLPVTLVSDNKTEVSINRVGRFGSFESQQIELRPGSYVAVGSRPGYRDVRLEFRVAPEAEMDPIVVKCEEKI